MPLSPYLLERFKPALRSSSSNDSFLLGTDQGYKVFYVPFELTNPSARLALVGITPGPTQMLKAYAAARAALQTRATDEEVLRSSKKAAAFAGMRDRINEMLDHFEVPKRLGLANAESLWSTNFHYFQPTSIVPNAAFKGDDYFNGPFSSVLAVPLLRQQFEKVFVPSIERLGKSVAYIAMGPVVDEALQWCVSRGVLDSKQLLGYFPHPSGSSGSQFSYFMRKKPLHELKPQDPVRHRVRDLDAAYERLTINARKIVWPAT